ncbi:hypothetical protein TIFTF001_002144 [Ficus carica]|uniref:Uncharacterized protein n=1 Tax=Ficus carica TaxID=3494 RepID=A0AA87ZLI1_FICCA|nr:hypothetical protein TIFTF001_002144 [Ficus carica]
MPNASNPLFSPSLSLVVVVDLAGTLVRISPVGASREEAVAGEDDELGVLTTTRTDDADINRDCVAILPSCDRGHFDRGRSQLHRRCQRA